MLSQITIQNFGLIERLSIDLAEHLNILTGETGAGKSIIIDALRYVLGERFETSLVRDPKVPCLVQAAFEINDKHLRQHPLFADYLTDGESQLIIERSFQPDGKNKVKINGLALTVGQLKEIGNHLIDFHGAHDHQMLLQEEQHILMLDKLISWENLKNDYQETFAIYSGLLKKLHELSNLAQTNKRDIELLKHQISELEQVPLSEEEFQKTEQDQLKINNAQRLSSCVEQILGLFEDEETGIETLLRKSFSPLKTLSQIDPSTSGLSDNLTAAQESTQNFLDNLRGYADTLTFNAQEAE
ncbi:MAG: AAA family ATPase, partial [Candidatus Omnitrophica bacterium]|nr:AAA family ATPase [Candidatus Omnitrophota bacterium]